MAKGNGATAASGCVCVGLILFTCICGFPMIVAGIVLIVLFDENIAGISLIAVAAFLVLAGIIIMVLMCVGLVGRKGYNQKSYAFASSTPTTPGRGTSVVRTQQAQIKLKPPPVRQNRDPPDYQGVLPYHTQQQQAQVQVHPQLAPQNARGYKTVPTVEPSAPPNAELN